MRKLLLFIIFIPILLVSCGNDNDDNNIDPIKKYKYKYVIFNDERENGIYDITIINSDAFDNIIDTKSIDRIDYNLKSDTIYTNGTRVSFIYKYLNSSGEEKSWQRLSVFIKEDYPNVISIFGFNDDRGKK